MGIVPYGGRFAERCGHRSVSGIFAARCGHRALRQRVFVNAAQRVVEKKAQWLHALRRRDAGGDEAVEALKFIVGKLARDQPAFVFQVFRGGVAVLPPGAQKGRPVTTLSGSPTRFGMTVWVGVLKVSRDFVMPLKN